MTLLGVWVQEHNSLPDNQSQIYDSYLHGRLTFCQRKLTEKGAADDMLQPLQLSLGFCLNPKYMDWKRQFQ